MNTVKNRFFPFLAVVVGCVFNHSCKEVSPTPSKAENDTEPAESANVVRQAAEFEAQEALWLIWNPYDHKKGASNASVVQQLVDLVKEHQKVVLAVADSTVYKDAVSHLLPSIREHPNVVFAFVPSVQFWTRDMGPSFVNLKDGTLAVADFNFNSWGYATVDDADNQIEEAFDRLAAKQLGLPIVRSKMISEGGNREVNGKGVLVTVETVEQGRNPSLSKPEMEAEFQRMLGVKKTIWLKEGLKEDEHTFLGPIKTNDGFDAYTVVTTNGHVDEFARFINDSTLLLAEVDSIQLQSGDPIALENHRRLEENFNILKRATDVDGKPFTIVRFPMPDPIYASMEPGDEVYDYIETLDYNKGTAPFPKGKKVQVIAAASYLNFIITNKLVIGQKYADDTETGRAVALDSIAKSILQQMFPERAVHMVDALAVNLGGGGVHCISIHQPKHHVQ